nr:hypothetical protein CFP56_67892 [Quercus suber]
MFSCYHFGGERKKQSPYLNVPTAPPYLSYRLSLSLGAVVIKERGLEDEGKGSGKTVGKVLRVELNERRAIGLGSAESGAALGTALGVAPCRILGAAGAASDGAVGMVLRSIEIEEGRLSVSTD